MQWLIVRGSNKIALIESDARPETPAGATVWRVPGHLNLRPTSTRDALAAAWKAAKRLSLRVPI